MERRSTPLVFPLRGGPMTSAPLCRAAAIHPHPAPLAAIQEQQAKGMDSAVVPIPFNSARATYEDRAADYVTSEPALDYTALSILLIAAVGGGS